MLDAKPEHPREMAPQQNDHFVLYPLLFIKEEWTHRRNILILKFLGILLVIFSGWLYLFTNQYNATRFMDTKPFIWMFSIDQHIPFSKFSIIPYYYYYLYVGGTLIAFFLKKNSALFFRQVFAMTLGSMISAVIFVVFPTYVPRIDLIETDLLTQMMKFIHAQDPPYNCFPSMHVLFTFVSFWHLSVLKKKSFWFMVFNGLSLVLISISTVFTKQHYTPDILGGLALGAISCLIFTWIYSRYFTKLNKNTA